MRLRPQRGAVEVLQQQVTGSVVEISARLVSDGIGVFPRVGGELAAVTDECRRDIAHETVGTESVCAVTRCLDLLYEVEGDAQLLVEEEGTLLDLRFGAAEGDFDIAGIHCRVPYPSDVHYASVLLA